MVRYTVFCPGTGEEKRGGGGRMKGKSLAQITKSALRPCLSVDSCRPAGTFFFLFLFFCYLGSHRRSGYCIFLYPPTQRLFDSRIVVVYKLSALTWLQVRRRLVNGRFSEWTSVYMSIERSLVFPPLHRNHTLSYVHGQLRGPARSMWPGDFCLIGDTPFK
ncbi:hypothetical protein F4775DRAFT_462394 [Biscogniauxia sp. FL1348]|nr:hypothetical protein F4775DRAFT_462394 [Biscogniauxia sp. FL1348]